MIRAIVAGVTILLSAMALSVVSAWLIARAWQQPNVMELTVAITAVRALGISRAAFRYIDRLASHDVALSRAADARVGVYRRLAGANPAAVMGMGRGALLTRIGVDVDALADRIVRSTIPRWVAAVTSLLAVSFLALLAPIAAAVLAVGLLVAGVVAPWLAGRGERQALAAVAVEGYVAEVDHVLRAAPTLRIRGQLDAALQRAEQAEHEVSRARGRGLTWVARSQGLWTLASVLTAAAVVWLGVTEFSGALFGAGGLGALDHAATRSPQWLTVVALLPLAAFEAVSVLPDATRARIKALHSEQRLAALPEVTADNVAPAPVSAEAPVADGAIGEAGGVLAKNLTVGWDTPCATYDLDVPVGGRAEIVAPSGAGKTTLLMTLAGLLPAHSGTFEAPGALFIAEDEHVLATTVRDNLAIGAPTATDEEMWEVLGAVGLASWVRELPKGLATVLARGDGDLSGGQRRRLIIARALLTDAPTLLLDEPTEHMDATGADELLALLGFVGGAGSAAGCTGAAVLPGRRAQRTIVMVRHPR